MENKKLVGRIKPHKGHTLYEFDTATCLLTKVNEEEFTRELVKSDKHWGFDYSCGYTAKQGCVYVSALNFKNAVKRLSKYYGIEVKL